MLLAAVKKKRRNIDTYALIHSRCLTTIVSEPLTLHSLPVERRRIANAITTMLTLACVPSAADVRRTCLSCMSCVNDSRYMELWPHRNWKRNEIWRMIWWEQYRHMHFVNISSAHLISQRKKMPRRVGNCWIIYSISLLIIASSQIWLKHWEQIV